MIISNADSSPETRAKNKRYPYLGIHCRHNYIVGFFRRNTGVLLNKGNEELPCPLFWTLDCWKEEHFLPYDGDLILRNDFFSLISNRAD